MPGEFFTFEELDSIFRSERTAALAVSAAGHGNDPRRQRCGEMLQLMVDGS